MEVVGAKVDGGMWWWERQGVVLDTPEVLYSYGKGMRWYSNAQQSTTTMRVIVTACKVEFIHNQQTSHDQRDNVQNKKSFTKSIFL
jgi:hypothetical protein